ncbi:MAG: galactose oxidase-like domain-containing protein [Rhodoblastus sp.]
MTKVRKALYLSTVFTGSLAFAPGAFALSLPKNTVQLKNQETNLCLNVNGGGNDNNTNLIVYPCEGATNEQFRFIAEGDAFYIVGVRSSKCLSLEGDVAQAHVRVVQYSCGQYRTQLWQPYNSNGTWKLKNKASGNCAGRYAHQTAVMTPITMGTCEERSTYAWTFVDQKFSAGSKGFVGEWSAPIAFPLVPVTISTLWTGKVLLMSGSAPNYFGGGNQTFSVQYDPKTGSQVSKLLNQPGREYFCEGTAMLPDGSLLVTGGTNTTASTLIDTNGKVKETSNLNIPRGYAGQTITSEGKVLTIGGSWSGGSSIKKGELYTPGSGWKVLNGVNPTDFNTADPAGLFRQDNHMWLTAASGGWVLHSGPSKKMHWVSTQGDGAIVNAGARGAMDNMNGNAVVYDVGKILTLGGAVAYNYASPTNADHIVDFSAGAPVPPKVTQTGSMAYARSFVNSVVLPSGDVVAIGGQGEGATAFSDVNSVLTPEIWSPKTNAFVKVAAMQTPRNYHSVATLLMDGRVIAAGGGLCGCAADHPNGEIFSPPYLFTESGEPAVRPRLIDAPYTNVRGAVIPVQATDAFSFVLVRLGSATHSVNNDQRRIPLKITSRNGNTTYMQLPSDAGVMPSGVYMLYALNAMGTPGVASMLHIQ